MSSALCVTIIEMLLMFCKHIVTGVDRVSWRFGCNSLSVVQPITVATTTTTTNVIDYSAAITQLRAQFTKSRSKTVAYSMQTSADRRSRRRHVSHMTDEKGEGSPSGMSKVRSRPESPVADCSMHALQPPERCGHQR